MKTIFNEHGEPIGTERDLDPWEEQDYLDSIMESMPDPEIHSAGCYFCGREYDQDCMIRIEVKNLKTSRTTEQFVCGYCEDHLDEPLPSKDLVILY